MQRYSLLCLTLVFVGLACSRPSSAEASTITAKLNNGPLGQDMNIDLNIPGGTNYQYTNQYVGEYGWTRSSVNNSNNNYSGPPNLGQNFISFCIELTQDMTYGSSYTYNVVSLASSPNPNGTDTGISSGGMGTTRADEISELWGRDFSSISTSTQAAAFQVAIWQIEYGTNLTINNAANDISFSNDSSAINQAQTWLNQLDGDTADYASLAAISNSNQQDQVIVVPTPKAVWMGLFMVGAMGWVGLKRRGTALRAAQVIA
jgi:hypothetical protein